MNFTEAELLALTKDPESYTCLCISTAHIQEDDALRLNIAAISDPPNPMILSRDTGFFVKLYEKHSSEVIDSLSLPARKVFALAYAHGYRMVELDCDAKIYEGLETFEW